jgi:hypothetical protein
MNTLVPIGATALVPHNMDEAMRLATAMANAKMLPKHLQDDVGTCLMVVEQAMRWGMSPFAVAQCTSNIGGKLMYEGKLVAAAVQSQGGIVGHFDYQFSGAGDERTITVSATRNGEKERRSITIRMGDVKTTNAMWTKQPDQQLVYSGTRNWARRWAPAALLGVYAPEEFNRATGEVFDGTTLDAEPEAPPLRAAAAPMPRADRIAEKAPAYEAPPQPKQTIGQFLDSLEIAVRDCDSLAAVNRINASPKVVQARQSLKNGALERLERIIAAGLAAHAPVTYPTDDDGDAASEDDLEEVQIAGADKMAAG